VRWSPDRAFEQVPDPVLQDPVGWQPDREADALGFKKLVCLGDTIFQMAEVAVPRQMFADILSLIGRLRAQFPAARFVHLHRDGPDCALSMSRHPMFRREVLAAAARHATGLPPASRLPQVDAALPVRLRGMICPPYDAARLMAHPIPAAVFGRDFWSPMICAGQAALRELSPGRRTRLRYEDLLRDPVASLTRLAGFIGVTAPTSWLDQAREMIDPAQARRVGAAAAELDPDAFAALAAACEPGALALRSEAP